MKINLSSAIIEKVQTMADHSIQLRLGLPEMSPDEMTKVFSVLNKEVVEIEFDADVDDKSPSKRLRATLYVLWEQKHKDEYQDFEVFYRTRMERLINQIKEKLT